MITFKQKTYTQWDQTDQIKQMKDSDILAEKKRSNWGLRADTLKSAGVGAAVGAGVGSVLSMATKGKFGGAKAGALLGGLAGGLSNTHSQEKKENNFYNNRLEYAQKQALRREKKDWKTNMTGREGYTY